MAAFTPLTVQADELVALLQRAAGIVDRHGKVHAPKGLGKASGRFTSKSDAEVFDERITKAASGLDALDAANGRATQGRIDVTPDPGWTYEQERARYHSLSAYRKDARPINQHLRQGDGSAEVAQQVADIDDVLAHSKLDTDAELWRGVLAFDEAINARLDAGRDLVGVEWSDKAFTSTSARQRFAETEGNGPSYWGRPGIVMRILAPKGLGAVQLSKPTYEAEVLLPRDLGFKVVKDYGFQPPRQEGVGLGFRRVDVELTGPRVQALGK